MFEKIIEQYKSVCETEAEKWNVSSVIHPDDFIFRFLYDHPSFTSKESAIEYYFRDGRHSAQQLKEILETVCRFDGKQEIRLLEFASGYGCVTRHIKNVIPFAVTTACDIHPQATQFIKETIGAEAILSRSRPEDLVLDQGFDVVFALSFFSHMPKSSFSRWLRQLVSLIKSGGYLIFTTHGMVSKTILVNNGPFDEEGFSFVPDSEQKDLDTAEYGVACTTPQYVFAQISKMPNCRLKYFHEAHWWTHQDVYVIQKIENETRQSISQGQAKLEQTLWRIRVMLAPHGSRRERLGRWVMDRWRGRRA